MKDVGAKWSLTCEPIRRLTDPSGQASALTDPKLLRLIERVALSSCPISRQELAKELWPSSSHALPNENVRSAIYSIRKICGQDFLIIVGNSVWIDSDQIEVIRSKHQSSKNECLAHSVPRNVYDLLHSDSAGLADTLMSLEFAFEVAPVDQGIELLSKSLKQSSLGSARRRIQAMKLYLMTVQGTSLPHMSEIDNLIDAFRKDNDFRGLFRICIAASHTQMSVCNMSKSRKYATLAVEAGTRTGDSETLGQAKLASGLVSLHSNDHVQAELSLLASKNLFLTSGNLVLAGAAEMILTESAFAQGNFELAEKRILNMDEYLAADTGRIRGWAEIQRARWDRMMSKSETALDRLVTVIRETRNQAGFSAHARAHAEVAEVLADQGEWFEAAVHLSFGDRYRWQLNARASELESRMSKPLRNRISGRLSESDLRSVRRMASRRIETAFASMH